VCVYVYIYIYIYIHILRRDEVSDRPRAERWEKERKSEGGKKPLAVQEIYGEGTKQV
jgi:hypothetical protein